MKTLNVVAAIIYKNTEKGRMIFATQKGYGKFKGLWEFPGGKIELGESSEDALIREIKEELDIQVKIETFIKKVEYNYPDFHLDMDCFWCKIEEGTICLKEASDGRWLYKDEIISLPWLPADIELVKLISDSL